eukprot:snap_masked-scaffold_69-processed-gene-0.28-mRNA-1 protein AED:0.72 eAED:1.00 QI:0/0/0/0.33/1/1/3/0/86
MIRESVQYFLTDTIIFSEIRATAFSPYSIHKHKEQILVHIPIGQKEPITCFNFPSYSCLRLKNKKKLRKERRYEEKFVAVIYYSSR